jgi:hypothetical protein
VSLTETWEISVTRVIDGRNDPDADSRKKRRQQKKTLKTILIEFNCVVAKKNSKIYIYDFKRLKRLPVGEVRDMALF